MSHDFTFKSHVISSIRMCHRPWANKAAFQSPKSTGSCTAIDINGHTYRQTPAFRPTDWQTESYWDCSAGYTGSAVCVCVGRQLSFSLTLSAHTLVGETRASLTLYTLNTRSLWFEALGCSSFLQRRSPPIWKANRPTPELLKSHTHTCFLLR